MRVRVPPSAQSQHVRKKNSKYNKKKFLRWVADGEGCVSIRKDNENGGEIPVYDGGDREEYLSSCDGMGINLIKALLSSNSPRIKLTAIYSENIERMYWDSLEPDKLQKI